MLRGEGWGGPPLIKIFWGGTPLTLFPPFTKMFRAVVVPLLFLLKCSDGEGGVVPSPSPRHNIFWRGGGTTPSSPPGFTIRPP